MKITCPVCVGRGWADRGMTDVGTKPSCNSCNGIGTINITALNAQVDSINAKMDKVREHLHEAKVLLVLGHPLDAQMEIINALIAIGGSV